MKINIILRCSSYSKSKSYYLIIFSVCLSVCTSGLLCLSFYFSPHLLSLSLSPISFSFSVLSMSLMINLYTFPLSVSNYSFSHFQWLSSSHCAWLTPTLSFFISQSVCLSVSLSVSLNTCILPDNNIIPKYTIGDTNEDRYEFSIT